MRRSCGHRLGERDGPGGDHGIEVVQRHAAGEKQVEAYERSGGEQANTLKDTGLAVIIVTMRGNKSGKVRKIALMRVAHNGEYALVASKGGAPKHPVWYYNLEANPDDLLKLFQAQEINIVVAGGRTQGAWKIYEGVRPKDCTVSIDAWR